MGADAQAGLQRIITVHAENARLSSVLGLVAREAGLRLSYNAAAVPGDSIVSLHAQQWTTERALKSVLPASVRWKESGAHLIITPLPGAKRRFEVQGAVVDVVTGAPIARATVFEMRRSNATTTDARGAFGLALSGELERTPLLIARSGYQDTVVFVGRDEAPARFALRPIDPVSRIEPICHFDRCGVEDLGMARLLVPASRMDQAANLDHSETRTIQLSLVPTVSTNGPIAGAVVNRVSINILGGYARGVDGAEVGGGLNLLSHDMKGVQIGGLANLVGGRTSGVQIAGGINHGMRSLQGLQLAGLGNTVWDTLSGAQVAGGVNVVKRGMTGAQISGAANVALGDLDGYQASGGINVAHGRVNKAQVSGAVNYARSVKGAQVSAGINVSLGEVGGGQVGFGGNYARAVSGGQFSFGINAAPGEVSGGQVGFGINYAGSVTGGQVGFGINASPGTVTGRQVGAVNFAWRALGGQLGFINLSDTLGKGAVGLFTFAIKGYHRAELLTNDALPLTARLRTGTRAFHNILGYAKAVVPDGRWAFLYGFGTEPRLGEHVILHIELTAQQVVEQEAWVDAVNILGGFAIKPGIDVAERIAITGGPVARVHVSDLRDPETGAYISELPPSRLWHEEFIGDQRITAWLGWELGVGVRF